METVTVNAVGRTRRVVKDGREYLVAPMTMIVSGVLGGSKGSLYYPPSEIEASAPAWDNIPITVYHPMTPDGSHVSANHPGILDKQGIGFLAKPSYERSRQRLKAEGWFDAERTKQVDPRVYESLVNGQVQPLSTGLFTDNDVAPANSVHNSPRGPRGYTHVARAYVPDHLAVLPDQVGACSIADGCGVLVNKKECQCGGECEECRVARAPAGYQVSQSGEGSMTGTTANRFCPTGAGGGVDPSCGSEGGGSTSESSAKGSVKTRALQRYAGVASRLLTAAVDTLITKATEAKDFAVKTGTDPKAAWGDIKQAAVNKYNGMVERYGKAGAIATMAGMAALVPVPVPGASFVPIGIAEGVKFIHSRLKKESSSGGVSLATANVAWLGSPIGYSPWTVWDIVSNADEEATDHLEDMVDDAYEFLSGQFKGEKTFEPASTKAKLRREILKVLDSQNVPIEQVDNWCNQHGGTTCKDKGSDSGKVPKPKVEKEVSGTQSKQGAGASDTGGGKAIGIRAAKDKVDAITKRLDAAKKLVEGIKSELVAAKVDLGKVRSSVESGVMKTSSVDTSSVIDRVKRLQEEAGNDQQHSYEDIISSLKSLNLKGLKVSHLKEIAKGVGADARSSKKGDLIDAIERKPLLIRENLIGKST